MTSTSWAFLATLFYVRWLEDLRLEMLTRHFPLEEQLKEGMAPVILQTTIDYKQSVRIADDPSGRMWMKGVGPLRWTVSAVIAVDGKVAALAEQIGIFIDLQSNKPIRMPETLKHTYQAFAAQTSQ